MNFTREVSGMDSSYFNILDSIDPRFHSYVLTKIREIEETRGLGSPTIEDFDMGDQLDVLRKYCVTLHSEYSVLRSFILENMEVCSRSIRVKALMK
jgi:hypothetical protein